MRFIETAKEISRKYILKLQIYYHIEFILGKFCISLDLESDLTQLSLLLQEQRNVLSALAGDKPGSSRTTNLERNVENVEDTESGEQMQEDMQNNQAIRAVREMVPSYSGNLEGKTFLNQGALTELDSNDYRPLQRVFFFLFNDVLMVCKVKHDK